mmetsp:Transcript_8743/g.24664  ORF Transcript_8743/g.24664 Transcript_8743/m.24664 type:complete len:187 (+) Transcript_8743:146-706(+)
MLILLDHLQLRAGVGWPILSRCSSEIPHLHKLEKAPSDWILALQSFLHTCGDGALEVADAWLPELQRLGDVFIMEALNDGSATAAELTLANEYRMYKNVLTLADITSIDGNDPATSFEEHAHRLPEHVQRTIGRMSCDPDELEQIADNSKLRVLGECSKVEKKRETTATLRGLTLAAAAASCSSSQ